MNVRWSLGLAVALVCVGLSESSAHEVRGTGYEPCHLLCSNEAGRVEMRSRNAGTKQATFGLRLETVYVSLEGIYLEDEYKGLGDDAEVFALEFLTAAWWMPTPWLSLSVGMPWEYNRATGVVLPTLHANPDQTTQEFEPGGIFASARFRLPTPEQWAVEPWIGLGYRLSTPIGTSDISRGDLALNPDKALEGLGVGSDDVYLMLEAAWPALMGPWTLSAGLEGRLHMLPRWETLFGSTLAYQIQVSRPLSTSWALSLRASGFLTALHTLDLRQHSALILTPGLEVALLEGLRLRAALSAEVPGELLNQNALQTFNAHLGIEALF